MKFYDFVIWSVVRIGLVGFPQKTHQCWEHNCNYTKHEGCNRHGNGYFMYHLQYIQNKSIFFNNILSFQNKTITLHLIQLNLPNNERS